jgi:hypothetical protein
MRPKQRLPERDDMPMIDPPIRLASNPPEVIDSTEGAARFMERRDGDAFDIEAAVVIRLLREASTPQAVVAASEAFRDWADGLGFLEEPAPDAELMRVDAATSGKRVGVREDARHAPANDVRPGWFSIGAERSLAAVG